MVGKKTHPVRANPFFPNPERPKLDFQNEGPRHASGMLGMTGLPANSLSKGGWGRAPGDIVLIFEGRYRCKWDPKNEAHRKRDLIWRSSRASFRAAAGDEESTSRASYHVRV